MSVDTSIASALTSAGASFVPRSSCAIHFRNTGKYTVNNVGEGAAAIESGWNPFAAPIY